MADIEDIVSLVQGDEIDITITVTNAIEQGVDISTATVMKFVVQPENSDTKSFEKAIGSGVTLVDADEFKISLDRDDTMTLTPGNYLIQALSTVDGKTKAIEITPNFIVIKKSLDFS